MMHLPSDRVLVGVDLALLVAVAAVGALGDILPLPAGQDILQIQSDNGSKPPPVGEHDPLPPPPPVGEHDPLPPLPKPGEIEWGRAQAAKAKAMEKIGEARDAKPSEPQKKINAYEAAEAKLKEALAAIEQYKKIRPEPNPAIDDEITDIRQRIIECHKNKPMIVK